MHVLEYLLYFQSLDRMMSIPVKYTLKRRLNDDEIEQISSKRFKQLETEYTRNDDEENDEEQSVENDTILKTEQ